jgi:outer membrane immunogenic protein
MRKYLLAALAAGVATAPAVAQDTAASPFTGPRVGAIVGYDSIGAGSEADTDNDENDQSVEGLLYGVEVGFDADVGGAVVGVEAELTDSTGKYEVNSSDPEFFGFGRIATDRDIYIGARAGILATPNTLVYAKGGYTNARLNVLGTDGETEFDENYKLDGWRLGAGVEQSFGNNTYAKLEYRYSNYDEGEIEIDEGDEFEFDNIDVDRHQVAVGVGVRF